MSVSYKDIGTMSQKAPQTSNDVVGLIVKAIEDVAATSHHDEWMKKLADAEEKFGNPKRSSDGIENAFRLNDKKWQPKCGS